MYVKPPSFLAGEMDGVRPVCLSDAAPRALNVSIVTLSWWWAKEELNAPYEPKPDIMEF